MQQDVVVGRNLRAYRQIAQGSRPRDLTNLIAGRHCPADSESLVAARLTTYRYRSDAGGAEISDKVDRRASRGATRTNNQLTQLSCSKQILAQIGRGAVDVFAFNRPTADRVECDR